MIVETRGEHALPGLRQLHDALAAVDIHSDKDNDPRQALDLLVSMDWADWNNSRACSADAGAPGVHGSLDEQNCLLNPCFYALGQGWDMDGGCACTETCRLPSAGAGTLPRATAA